MLRKTFQADIKQVKGEVLLLGSMVEQAVLDSVEALRVRDLKAAQRIFDGDLEINQKRFDIEGKTVILIATQQPMAHDLRLLASILEISAELERMGDYAKGIARINLRMGEEPLLEPLTDLPRMAQKGVEMLRSALTAFVNEDIEAARRIPAEDDEVDELYKRVYQELLAHVIADASAIERANWLMWAAHNLERLADRVTNICERTVFIVTGELVEIASSDSAIWRTAKK